MEREQDEQCASPINDGYERSPTLLATGGASPAKIPSGHPPSDAKTPKTFFRKLLKPIPLLTTVIAGAAIIQCAVTYWQWDTMKGQLEEMRTQSTSMRDELIESARPWLRIKHEIASPLTFTDAGAAITLRDNVRNVGASPALTVLIWEVLAPLDSGDGPADSVVATARATRDDQCDMQRHPEPVELNEGFTLFQDDSLNRDSILTLPMETVRSATHDGRMGIAIVGCVSYRFSFEKESDATHQTRFIYFLGEPRPISFMALIQPKGVADNVGLFVTQLGFTAD